LGQKLQISDFQYHFGNCINCSHCLYPGSTNYIPTGAYHVSLNIKVNRFEWWIIIASCAVFMILSEIYKLIKRAIKKLPAPNFTRHLSKEMLAELEGANEADKSLVA